MISFKHKTITIDGKTEPIKEFKAMFIVRGGLCTLDEAIKYCLDNDFDPELMIQSVVVVQSETMYELLMR